LCVLKVKGVLLAKLKECMVIHMVEDDKQLCRTIILPKVKQGKAEEMNKALR